MDENAISKVILDCAFKIHTSLGAGLLEKVYRECLAYEITKEHIAQTLTYMRFSNCKLGLILNFYKSSLKDGIKRLII
jgi:hypothetical protein